MDRRSVWLSNYSKVVTKKASFNQYGYRKRPQHLLMQQKNYVTERNCEEDKQSGYGIEKSRRPCWLWPTQLQGRSSSKHLLNCLPYTYSLNLTKSSTNRLHLT